MEDKNKPQSTCMWNWLSFFLLPCCSTLPLLRGGEDAMGSINRILGDADLCSDPGHLFLQSSEFFRRIEYGA